MDIQVYTGTHIWTYRYIQVHIYGHTGIYRYTYMDIQVYTGTHIWTYRYIQVHIYGHTGIYRYTYMDIQVCDACTESWFVVSRG